MGESEIVLNTISESKSDNAYDVMAKYSIDSLGHDLIRQRLAQIPVFLLEMLKKKTISISTNIYVAQSFIVTGIGSSEAHARYLTLLLNTYTNRRAQFIGFTAFTTATAKVFHSDQILILYSQGLSPNAQMVLSYGQTYFSRVLLFTSMNNEQLKSKCPWILSDKLETIQFPLHDEYTTLIRVIGPACGFLAAILFMQQLTDQQLVEHDQLQQIILATSSLSLSISSQSALLQAMLEDTEHQFSRGPFYLILSAPLIDVCQNIQYKLLEGLFYSMPVLCDYLQFAHGTYQQLRSITDRPSAIVCIVNQSNALDAELERRLREMIESHSDRRQLINIYTLYLCSSPSIIYSLLELEMLFNRLVFGIMCERRCNQINWPGKGEDQPLYGFSGSSSSLE
ncbi:unnamed protein product [Adineta ricciae]|uniref:Uncharacterized protein n=1 Tax=Adineta ricciae TaxID=249248 RepID=A0A815NLD0_ADIRI|nr:unnamed protein product [Adineta ricciae]